MDRWEEITEVDNMLRKNEEDTETLQQYISYLRDEEEFFREDSFSCMKNMDRFLDDVKGAVFEKIHSNAFFELDKIKHNVEIAFQEEHEQLKERLNTLFYERDDLLNRKRQLEEEAEQE